MPRGHNKATVRIAHPGVSAGIDPAAITQAKQQVSQSGLEEQQSYGQVAQAAVETPATVASYAESFRAYQTQMTYGTLALAAVHAVTGRTTGRS